MLWLQSIGGSAVALPPSYLFVFDSVVCSRCFCRGCRLRSLARICALLTLCFAVHRRVCCCSCRGAHLWLPALICVSVSCKPKDGLMLLLPPLSVFSSLTLISLTQISLIQYHSHSTHAPHLKHIIPPSNHLVNTFNSSHASISLSLSNIISFNVIVIHLNPPLSSSPVAHSHPA